MSPKSKNEKSIDLGNSSLQTVEDIDSPAEPANFTKGGIKRVEDLEVKDAQLIFHSIWHELEQEVGVENLHFIVVHLVKPTVATSLPSCGRAIG